MPESSEKALQLYSGSQTSMNIFMAVTLLFKQTINHFSSFFQGRQADIATYKS